MVIFVDVTIENIKEDNPNWSQIPDYPYGLLITGGSGLLKTHALLNLINLQSDIDKTYAKGPYKAK